MAHKTKSKKKNIKNDIEESQDLKRFMNIFSTEDSEKIHKIIATFNKDSAQELEISFKDMNYSKYFRMVKHYVSITSESNISQQEYLDINVVLPDNNVYRYVLLNEETIQKFLNDFTKKKVNDVLKYLETLVSSKNVEIMSKNRGAALTHFMTDFNIMIRTTPENEIKGKIKFTGQERILYRYKNRVRFDDDTETSHTDITEVRESTVLADLFAKYAKYEMELEFVDHEISKEKFFKLLYQTLGTIQESAHPLSKTEINTVLEKYQKLLGITNSTHLDSRNVISLEIQHVVKFIPNRYAVTDKADGERYFLFIIDDTSYLLSTNLHVKKINAGFEFDKKFDGTILDGELVRIGTHDVFFAFDVVYANKIDYRYDTKNNLPVRIDILNRILDECFGTYVKVSYYYEENKDMELLNIRKYYLKTMKTYWKEMNQLIGIFADNLSEQEKSGQQYPSVMITRKHYFVPDGIDSSEVFMYADLITKLYVYEGITPYKLDGVIYTPINSPYSIKINLADLDSNPLEYKWKQPNQNSIDFYVEVVKDEETDKDFIFYDTHSKTDATDGYKVFNLFVGQHKGGEEKPIPFKINDLPQKAYIPIIDGDARNMDGDIINNNTVVEFVFDSTKPINDNAYKWTALKTRHDKTESVHKYKKRYGNNLYIALRIWRTITNPLTEDMIATLGNPDTYEKEFDRLSGTMSKSIKLKSEPKIDGAYYGKIAKKAGADAMRTFNNLVKSNMIMTYCRNRQSVLDIGCGRGGDLHKITNAGIKEYVGVDKDYYGLFDKKDSALNRYQSIKKRLKNAPDAHFINVDARGLFNVPAQEAILSSMSDSNKKLIETYLSGNKKYNIINCQFSMHYYLSDEISWSNFLTNINDHLEIGGYILITCFDGDLVYDKLKGKNKMTVGYTNNHGSKETFFEIIKTYNDSDYDNTKIGLGINLYNSTISEPQTYIKEYLIFKSFLEESFKKNCDLELVETDTFFNLFNLYKHYFIKGDFDNFSQSDLSADTADADYSDTAHGLPKRKFEELKKFYKLLDPQCSNTYTADEIEYNLATFKFAMLYRYFVFKKSGTAKVNPYAQSHVIGVNNQLNVGRILTPHFEQNRMIIDPSRKSTNVNKIYNAILKAHPKTKPYVYLIRHTDTEQKVDDQIYHHEKFEFSKLKDGSSDKILLLYKSPDRVFFPIYYQSPKSNKYLLESKKFLKDLELMVKISTDYGTDAN